MEMLDVLLCAAIINCCFVIHCKGVSIIIPNTEEHNVLKGKSLLIECILSSGTLDRTLPRSWLADGVTVISDGISTSAGSGYSETLGNNNFSLSTPTLDYDADGRSYICKYGFNQATVNLKISGIGSTSKSSGECINGRSIENCWFSLSKVIPNVSSANLSVSYVNDTIENITSMLNESSKMNPDGKTWEYDYTIVQVPTSISNDVKTLTLSVDVGGYITVLTIMIQGLTTPASTISSDMSATVSEVPLPPITTSAAGLSQEKLIAIAISSALAVGLLILLVVLVVRQCRQKYKGTHAKNKENHFANKQDNLTKKDDFKSYKPRKSKLSEKRNTKRGSTSLKKKKNAQLENFAPKDKMYQHYSQTTDYWNNCGNQHIFNNSHNVENVMLYGNLHDNYLRPHSRPNNRMLYQSHYPRYPGHNEGIFQYYRADDLYRRQQMYQRPYVALYDTHIIDDKQDDKRSAKGRPYEKNWDLLY